MMHPGMCHPIYTIVYDVIIHSIINSYTIIVYNVISHTHTHIQIYYNNSYLDTYSVLTTCNCQVYFCSKCSILSEKIGLAAPTLNYFRTSECHHIYIIYNPCLDMCIYYGLLCCLAKQQHLEDNVDSSQCIYRLHVLCMCVFLFHQTSCISCNHVSCFFFFSFEHHAFVMFMLFMIF